MEALTFTIENEVIARFPEIRVAALAVADLPVAAGRLAHTSDLFQDARAALLSAGITADAIAQDARIRDWREAFAKCGLKPSTFRSSPEQLARRLLKGQSISTPLAIVNAYCAISARHLAPMGGYDLAKLPQKSIHLRLAQPQRDTFEPLGGRPEDMPITSEVVVYASGEKIICWAFNFRDSATTSLAQHTEAAVFFSEAVNLSQHESVLQSLSDLKLLLESHGATTGSIAEADVGRPSLNLLPQ